METRAMGYLGASQVKWSCHSLRATFCPEMKNPNRGGDGTADRQQAEMVWGALPSLILCWGPPELGEGGRKTALQRGSAQKGLLFFSRSPFSPAEPSFTQTTLLKKLKIPATGEVGRERGKAGSQQFIKWQQAREVETAGMGGSEGEGTLIRNALEAKQSILQKTLVPKAARAWRRPAAPGSFHLPLRGSQGCPRAPALPLSCAGGDACPENMAGWSIRDARATRGTVSVRDAASARRLREVGGGELEYPGWRQVQRVPAAPWRSLPPSPFPSFPFLLFSSSLLPFFLISAQPPSCLPDPRLSPPPAVTSKPKDKTRPPARGYLRSPSGREVRLGHCRSPGAHSAAARLILAHLSGPGGSCSFYGARRQRHCPGVPSPLTRAAAASMRAIHTQGPLLGPLGVRGLPPTPMHMAWGGGGSMGR